jgi:lipopolysaccharide export system permease protein
MKLIDRHLIGTILKSVALVLLVLLSLVALLRFIDQQDDIGVGQFGAWQALSFVLLNLPQQAADMLPIATLIGALLGLGALARDSEITVLRATGVSPARLALSGAGAAVLLMVAVLILGEFLAAPLQNYARQQKAFSKFTTVSFSGGSAWARDGNLILHVAQQSAERDFSGMRVFELTPEFRLRAMGQAQRATSQDNRLWRLLDYAESRFTLDRVLARRSGERRLDSSISSEFFGLAVTRPNQLRLTTLWRLIRHSKSNDLNTATYEFAFWSRIARTVAILFAVLLAIPFALTQLRAAGSGTRLLVGILLGVTFFILQQLVESGTLALGLSPILLAWVPTLLLATATGVLFGKYAR